MLSQINSIYMMNLKNLQTQQKRDKTFHRFVLQGRERAGRACAIRIASCEFSHACPDLCVCLASTRASTRTASMHKQHCKHSSVWLFFFNILVCTMIRIQQQTAVNSSVLHHTAAERGCVPPSYRRPATHSSAFFFSCKRLFQHRAQLQLQQKLQSSAASAVCFCWLQRDRNKIVLYKAYIRVVYIDHHIIRAQQYCCTTSLYQYEVRSI